MDARMRRIPLLCLLAALVVAPAAKAATPVQILRDCQDDGVLEGHYTAAELRNAERHLPTDVAEYTNCGDVLSRAADAAAAASSRPTPSAHAGTPRHPGGSAGAAPTATPTAAPTAVAQAPVGPSTPQDSQALAAAARQAAPPAINVRGRRVGAALAASVTRNPLPSSLLVVLILIAAAAVAAAAPVLRRVLARRRS